MFVDSRRLSPTPTTLTMLSMAFDKAGDQATAIILLGLAYVIDISKKEVIDNLDLSGCVIRGEL